MRGLALKIAFGWLYKLRTYSDLRMTAMLAAAGFGNVRVKSTLGMMQVYYGKKKDLK